MSDGGDFHLTFEGGEETQKGINFSLRAGAARVTSLSLIDGQLSLTIRAEIDDDTVSGFVRAAQSEAVAPAEAESEALEPSEEEQDFATGTATPHPAAEAANGVELEETAEDDDDDGLMLEDEEQVDLMTADRTDAAAPEASVELEEPEIDLEFEPVEDSRFADNPRYGEPQPDVEWDAAAPEPEAPEDSGETVILRDADRKRNDGSDIDSIPDIPDAPPFAPLPQDTAALSREETERIFQEDSVIDSLESTRIRLPEDQAEEPETKEGSEFVDDGIASDLLDPLDDEDEVPELSEGDGLVELGDEEEISDLIELGDEDQPADDVGDDPSAQPELSQSEPAASGATNTEDEAGSNETDDASSEAESQRSYIRFTCPKCSTVGVQASDKVGAVVTCKKCGKAMKLTVKRD